MKIKFNFKSILVSLVIIIAGLLTNSCEELTLEKLTISGSVVDANNPDKIISGASILIKNSGLETKLSDNEGKFVFNDLEFDDDTYEILTTATDYKPKTTFISVKNGSVNGGSVLVQMIPISSINVNTTGLDFGAAKVTSAVVVTNNSDLQIDGIIEIGANWLTVSTTQLKLEPRGTTSITFIADRSKTNFGTFSTNIIFNAKDADVENILIQASLQKIDPSNPSVSVNKTAIDFGKVATTEALEISNKGSVSLNWSATATENWIKVNKLSGALSADAKENLDITINRNNLAVGNYSGTINFIANGQTTTVDVTMQVEKVLHSDQDNDGVIDTEDVDDDNDGLMEIYTIDDLNNIRNDLDASGINYKGGPITGIIGYELMNDLDFNNENHYIDKNLKTQFTTGFGWNPLGDNSNEFNTIFEGNNHTIKNLFMNKTTDHTALFGYTQILSQIKNLHTRIRFIQGDENTGALIGYNRGNVTNCSAFGQVTSTSGHTGLLIGKSDSGNITGCYTEGLVNSNGVSSGGLIGEVSEKGKITYCYSKANVIGTSEAGGIIGLVINGDEIEIRSCYATGVVKTISYSNAGGLIGEVKWGSNNKVTNCYAKGNVVSNSSYAGGLIGSNGSASVVSSYSIGIAQIAGRYYLGGLIGSSSPSVLNTNYWDITTSGLTTSSNGAVGKTTSELQSPTATTGIYATWDANAWDFGTSNQYPALKNMPNGLAAQRN